IVVAVATDLDPVATTALAAVVEARVKAAGFDVDARVDRSAFRLRWASPENAKLAAFVGATSAAFAKPIASGAPELANVAQRLQSLKRNPLDAPELVPIVACTGALGVVASDPTIDASKSEGA